MWACTPDMCPTCSLIYTPGPTTPRASPIKHRNSTVALASRIVSAPPPRSFQSRWQMVDKAASSPGSSDTGSAATRTRGSKTATKKDATIKIAIGVLCQCRHRRTHIWPNTQSWLQMQISSMHACTLWLQLWNSVIRSRQRRRTHDRTQKRRHL
jgi:hypothetical protein